MPPNLLVTKLFVPPARANLVPRPRLLDRLQRGLAGKLTLIAAPAGFGKTTLLSAWHAALGPAAPALAWVSLDAADNDPPSFWSYVLAALDAVAPGIGTSALALLGSPQAPPIDSILTSVLNAFAQPGLGVESATGADERDIILVLEDYHVITAPAIHQSLSRLIEYLPPQLHLVIATRADPPLPLARLRASGTVTELHAGDLRFTPDETATLLNDVMRLALTADDLTTLEVRTEGWIAGLQLAAMALHDQRDRAGFIRTFGGSNRYILDYLAAEVFARQPAHVQTFLLQTSILDRMCAPLCAAIMGLAPEEERRSGTTEPATASALASAPSADLSSQDVLAELERANAFVVPLDDERQWYRYHHLFADALRRRLTRAAAVTLNGRASVWYEAHDLIAEAVHHALAAADAERVARLIEQHGLAVMLRGQVSSVLGWLDALPDGLIGTRPLLCLVHASALRFTNQSEAAEARLKDAERCIRNDTPPGQADFIRGRVASIRANIARYTGDLAGCVAFAEQALRLLPETQVVPRTFSQLNIARAFRVSGDVTEASERDATAVIAPIRASGNLVGTLVAVANLAWLQVLQGRLRTAAGTYHEMTQISAGQDNLQVLLGGVAYYAGLGDLLREWNDLDAASQHLTQAMALLKGTLTVDAEDVVLGYLALARLQLARGEYATARGTVASLRDVAQQRRFVAPLITRVAAVQAQLAITTGDLPTAAAWANTSGLHTDDALSFPREVEYLVLTRMWIAQAEKRPADAVLTQAFTLLHRLLHDATAKGRQSSVLDILIVRALAYWALGAHDAGLATIERALMLAEPEGYIRRFVDEGPAMEAILHAASARGIGPTYVARLLTSFSRRRDEVPGAAAGAPGLQTYGVPPILALNEGGGERLSARELEVLRLIASGKTNAEIARALVIAVSTVKSHTNSIFGKLDASSRSEAILRARMRNLL